LIGLISLLSTATAFILSLTACSSHAPEKRVHRILTDRIQTLAVAESCTGGTIAARFTAMPGASAYFLCGVVSYSNASKQAVLGVDPDTIARYGAVSEQVARQMAAEARRLRLSSGHREGGRLLREVPPVSVETADREEDFADPERSFGGRFRHICGPRGQREPSGRDDGRQSVEKTAHEMILGYFV